MKPVSLLSALKISHIPILPHSTKKGTDLPIIGRLWKCTWMKSLCPTCVLREIVHHVPYTAKYYAAVYSHKIIMEFGKE